MQQIVEVEGFEQIEQAQANGQGVIVLGPHFGNWEILGLYLDQQLDVTHYMFQPSDNPVLDKMVKESRGRSGATLAPTNASGVKILLKSA